MSGGGMPGGGVMGQQTQVPLIILVKLSWWNWSWGCPLMTNTFDLVLKKIPFRRGKLILTAVQMLGPERLEEPAEAAAQGREEEDLRRDGHQGQ